MRKGQAEVIVVFGVLLVIVVVAFYALQNSSIIPNPVPKGVYDEQREVSNTVNNMVRGAADNALREMMEHGGYLEDSSIAGIGYNDVPNTGFLLTRVPFWQRCDQVMYPDIRDIEVWMAKAIEKSVEEGLDDIEALYGNRASFDRNGIGATVTILGVNPIEPNVIKVEFRMPTTVREYDLAHDLYPYITNIDTKFGRIYSFGKDFSDASAEKRFFDVFTIAAIYFSQETTDGVKLPTIGVLTECGDVVYRNPEEINGYLLEILEYVLATASWWRPMENSCPDGTCLPMTLDFAIQNVNGRSYSDLDIRTMMSDYWVFDVFDFVLATNFKMPTSGWYRIPICTATFNHAYKFKYPLIIRVNDPYTGYNFNFASEVAVGDRGDEIMAPGDCNAIGSMSSECQELPCYGRVGVVNDLGEPMEDAWVVFGGCPVGDKTGPDGFTEGPIKCGTEKLFVYHTSEYEFLEREVSATDLNSTHIVTINPINQIRIHFREIKMTKTGYYTTEGDDPQTVHLTCDACEKNCGIESTTSYQCVTGLVDREHVYAEFDNGYGSLPVTNIDIANAPEECGEGLGCAFCREHADEAETANSSVRNTILSACRSCASGCYTTPLESTLVSYIPSGYTYTVDADMYDPMDEYKIKGMIESASFVLGRDDTDVYLYLPRRSSDRNTLYDMLPEDAEKTCLTNFASNICGMGPVVAETHAPTVVVVVNTTATCTYLRSFAEACGASATDISSLFCGCAHEGGTCGGQCGGLDEPACTWCCNRDSVLSYLTTIEESCGITLVII